MNRFVSVMPFCLFSLTVTNLKRTNYNGTFYFEIMKSCELSRRVWNIENVFIGCNFTESKSVRIILKVNFLASTMVFVSWGI